MVDLGFASESDKGAFDKWVGQRPSEMPFRE